MKILISGDSHVNGYAEAARSWPSKGFTLEIRNIGPSFGFRVPFHDVVDNAIVFRHAVFYLEAFARRLPHIPLARHGAAYDWYGFSGPLGVMDIYSDKRLFSGKRLAISRAAYRQIVFDQAGPWLRFLGQAKGLGLAVFVIEAPAPFASSPLVDHMRRYAGDESIVACDRIARSIVKGELNRLGVPVAALPAHVFAPSGFMGERFRHPNPGDPHHGNLTFATMMLRRSAQTLRHVQASGAMAGEQRQPTRAAEAEDGDFAVDTDYFRQVDETAGKWIIEPGPRHSDFSGPAGINFAPAAPFAGFAGLRLARSQPDRAPSHGAGGIVLELPAAVRAAVGGRRLGLGVLARSVREDRDTRFAVALSAPSTWSTGWCWFCCRETAGQRFCFDIPPLHEATPLRLELKPDDGRIGHVAASEILAIGIEVCEQQRPQP